MRGDRDGENARDRRADDQDRERVGEPRGERVAPGEPGELTIGCSHPAQCLLLAPVRHELGSAAEHLDELGCELTAHPGLTA